jgi:hypothetical protein
LILVLAVGLSGCSFVKERFAFLRRAPSDRMRTVSAPANLAAPKPAEGLWAILDPGCPKPNAINFKSWPHCASPFWISRDSAVVVQSLPGLRNGPSPDRSYRTDFSLAAGDPVIAQVGNAKDGYLFLALTELSRDEHGRLVAASGAAFVCAKASGGPIALAPNLNGCDTESPDGVRRAAQQTLGDHVVLSRVAWIASGAP